MNQFFLVILIGFPCLSLPDICRGSHKKFSEIMRKMYILCGKKLVCQNRAAKLTLSVEIIEVKDFACGDKNENQI